MVPKIENGASLFVEEELVLNVEEQKEIFRDIEMGKVGNAGDAKQKHN